MSKLTFVKYHGTGNDFVLVDDRDGSFPSENKSLIQKICHRRFGVGADGVILLSRSSVADFRMRIFNSDGCEAAMCGNGLRCLIRFIQDLGVSKKKYKIQTAEKVVEAAFILGRPVIDMGIPERLVLWATFINLSELRPAAALPDQSSFSAIEPAAMASSCRPLRFDPALPRSPEASDALMKAALGGDLHLIDTGVPHAVLFVPDVDRVDVAIEGALLRSKMKANIDFAALQADGSIRVRTFEKGVEGETFSCGTGAAAVAAVARRVYSLKMPIAIHFPGGSLEVWETDGRLHIAGPAEKVFTGSFQSSTMAP